MKSMKRDNSDIRAKICVIFPGALGDFICFLPALQALQERAAIDLFARSEFADLVLPGITVSSLERWEISGLFREGRGSAEAEKMFRAYDALYSWFASGHPRFVERLNAITGCRVHTFSFRPLATDVHLADHYFGCLREHATTPPPHVALRSEALQWRDIFWCDHTLAGRPVLTIAPGSGAREKNWPEKFYCAVAEWWRKATGGAIVLLIGPVEQERGGFERLSEGCLVASGLSLSRAAALLDRSAVYLGNDSGISHLAAALGIRTVALFGPTDPIRWAPRGQRVTVLRRGMDCSPCSEPVMKSCPHRACLSEFAAPEIISKLARLPEVVTLTR